MSLTLLVDKILSECDGLAPVEGAVFKFETPGQAIVARFVARRKGIKTKSVVGSATCLDVEILKATNGGMAGRATIFESSHISQIMDSANLTEGQAFLLKFYDEDKKTRFKRFAYRRVPELDARVEGGVPPSSPFDNDGDHSPF